MCIKEHYNTNFYVAIPVYCMYLQYSSKSKGEKIEEYERGHMRLKIRVLSEHASLQKVGGGGGEMGESFLPLRTRTYVLIPACTNHLLPRTTTKLFRTSHIFTCVFFRKQSRVRVVSPSCPVAIKLVPPPPPLHLLKSPTDLPLIEFRAINIYETKKGLYGSLQDPLQQKSNIFQNCHLS